MKFTEDEFDLEENKKQVLALNTASGTKEVPDVNGINSITGGGEQSRKRPRQLLTEKIAQEKKLEIEKEMKADRKKRPKNLLFTTGYSSEESIDVSDGEEKG